MELAPEEQALFPTPSVQNLVYTQEHTPAEQPATEEDYEITEILPVAGYTFAHANESSNWVFCKPKLLPLVTSTTPSTTETSEKSGNV
jgi:hypothetical protein